MKKSYLFLLLLLALLGSCKEKDPTNEELISRAWRVASILLNASADATTNYGSYRFTFNSSKTYTFTNAPIPGVLLTGTWELSGDCRTLTLNKGQASQKTAVVRQLTGENLNLEFT
ncbi:MAG: hypothetical protein H7Y04_05350 [Verrucomicrobia bacterium]|nr:hypothetical protein [Cytophagales bacterium]